MYWVKNPYNKNKKGGYIHGNERMWRNRKRGRTGNETGMFRSKRQELRSEDDESERALRVSVQADK